MTTTLIVIAVIVLVVLAVAFFVIRKRNQEADVARAEQLRAQAVTQAQTTLPPTQERAAEAEAKAAEARAVAERAQAEAEEARLTAARAEAEHEAQVRAADRIDPRVDHTSDDYAPQVGGTVDQQPAPPSEAAVAPDEASAERTESHEAPEPTEDSTEDPDTEDPDTQDPDTQDPGAQEPTPASGTPLLPRRTPGANEMPGKPLEAEGGSGGWFTHKDQSDKA